MRGGKSSKYKTNKNINKKWHDFKVGKMRREKVENIKQMKI